MRKKIMKEITLRSKGHYHFTGKKIFLRDGYVSFVGLVKAVCKNDHEGVNSNRFWGRLKDEVDDKDYTYIDNTLFVSAAVIEKITNSNATRCEKTWGFFHSDGLSYLLEDLGYSKTKRTADKSTPSSAGAGPSASKKGKHTVSSPSDDIDFNDTPQDFVSITRALLRQREKSLNDREQLLNQRSSLLSTRENECGEKEELLEKKLVDLNEREKRLNKQQQKSTVPELFEFMQKVSSLANQFKTKAARSRRNSSEEPVVSLSATPSLSDDQNEKDTPVKQKRQGNESRTPSQSPSPIRGSNPSSTEVRTCLTVRINNVFCDSVVYYYFPDYSLTSC